jgi:sugar porter (SP) family MFS transporter
MKQSKSYIIRVSLIVAIGGFLMGFDASVISGVIRFIEPQFDLTKIQLGWAVGCLTLTSTLAMIIAGPLSNKYGRRTILRYAAVLYAISAIASAFAPTFWILVVARMIGGFGVGASLILAPMYIAEISPAKIRGTMVSFNQLNIVVGISIAFFTNYLILKWGMEGSSLAKTLMIDEYNWRWMLGIETIPALLYFAFLFFVPESPRWLAMNGQEEKALSVLSKACSQEEASAALVAVREGVVAENKKKNPSSIKDLFKPALRIVLLIGVVIAVTQQITGINAVFFYAPMIFEQTGIGTDASFSQAILVGLTNVVFTILAMWLIDRVGRKLLLIVGLSGIILSMWLLSYGFGAATYQLNTANVQELTTKTDNNNWSKLENVVFNSDLDYKQAIIETIGSEQWKANESDFISRAIKINPFLVIIGILGFVASFAVSIGPVMWVLFSEIFPNSIRAVAISFTGFINSGISFLVQLVFPWELANFGSSTTFLLYGIFGIIGLLVAIFYLPETKGKTLEELEKILIRKK